MKTKTATRRALLLSFTSLLICAAMLVGTTFAWFTDSVTSGTNRIIAGNLDVELYHKNAAVTADDVKVDGNTPLFDAASSGILWEPGAVSYEVFTVKNVGTLALKYKLNAILADYDATTAGNQFYNTVVEVGGSATTYSLLDVLRVKEIDGDNAPSARPAYTTAESVTLGDYLDADHYAASALEPGASKTTTIVIFWPQSENDNNWNLQNGKYASDSPKASDPNATDVGSLKVGLAISLLATQQTSESDSFDNLYDETADTTAGDFSGTSMAVTINSDTAVAVDPAVITVDNSGTETVYTAPVADTTEATTIADTAATTTIPANAVATLTGYTEPAAGSDTVTDLSRKIETTDSSDGSVTYDISFKATVTTTGNETTTTNDYAVHKFSEIVSNEIYVGKGLTNVQVKHGSDDMIKLSTNAPADNSFYYDVTSGILYIYSSTYSAYSVTWEVSNYWIDLYAAAFAGGTGTENDPYQIATAEQLARLAYLMSNESERAAYAEKYYTLTANIDLSAKFWTPISCADRKTTRTAAGIETLFRGHFNGASHTITGLKNNSKELYKTSAHINDTTPANADGEYSFGLFGTVYNAEIKNITFANVNIDAVTTTVLGPNNLPYLGDSVGAAVGATAGATSVSGITVSGAIKGYDATGGIVGRRESGTLAVSGCTNNATITAVRRSAGLVGYGSGYYVNESTAETLVIKDANNAIGVTIANCANTGDINSLGLTNDIDTTKTSGDYYGAAIITHTMADASQYNPQTLNAALSVTGFQTASFGGTTTSIGRTAESDTTTYYLMNSFEHQG